MGNPQTPMLGKTIFPWYQTVIFSKGEVMVGVKGSAGITQSSGLVHLTTKWKQQFAHVRMSAKMLGGLQSHEILTVLFINPLTQYCLKFTKANYCPKDASHSPTLVYTLVCQLCSCLNTSSITSTHARSYFNDPHNMKCTNSNHRSKYRCGVTWPKINCRFPQL